MIDSKTIDIGINVFNAETLVMGVGNFLMGDEGIGVHIAQAMEKMKLPPYLNALDGGTGGFFLMGYFDEYSHVIFVDATMDGQPAGTVTLTEPKFASDFPSALSVHDVGLKDMIETLYFMGDVPKMYLITISIKEMIPMYVGLSPEVESSIPEVIDKILKLATEIHKWHNK
ncbi:MAG: hydrogenase maturation protease [Cyclobacteriaceae bacterium]|nr:hydrogenase maturation protease [Cyclobacteriaceae bacterium]